MRYRSGSVPGADPGSPAGRVERSSLSAGTASCRRRRGGGLATTRQRSDPDPLIRGADDRTLAFPKPPGRVTITFGMIGSASRGMTHLPVGER